MTNILSSNKARYEEYELSTIGPPATAIAGLIAFQNAGIRDEDMLRLCREQRAMFRVRPRQCYLASIMPRT